LKDYDDDRPDILGRKIDSNIPRSYPGWDRSQFKWLLMAFVIPIAILLGLVWWTR
jgi:hypothetical protein